MRYKFLLIIYFLLFFLSIKSFANDFNDNYFHCIQIPEGNPFGLIFNNNMVTQIGVENLSKVQDYSEPYSIINQGFKWLNVTLILKNLTLHIGNQKNNFARCQKVKTILELNELLENFINSEKNKNTI